MVSVRDKWIEGSNGKHIRYRRPFRPHSVSYRQQLWPHMDYAASRLGPSISHQEPFRLGLEECQGKRSRDEEDRGGFTESDAWVFLSNIVTLLVCEEHVGRETTLGCVGVCKDRDK